MRAVTKVRNVDGLFELPSETEIMECPLDIQEKFKKLEELIIKLNSLTSSIENMKEDLKVIPIRIKDAKRQRGYIIDEIVSLKRKLDVK